MRKIPDELHRTRADFHFKVATEAPRMWGYAATVLLTSADVIGEAIAAAQAGQIARAKAEAAELAKNPPAPGTVTSVTRQLQGDELKEHNTTQTVGTWAMLVSLAIENLLKGVIAGHGDAPPMHHKLLALADQAKFTRSPEEGKVLEDLSEYAVWKGRYLAPTNAKKLYELNRKSELQTDRALPLWPIERAQAICAPMIARLQQIIAGFPPYKSGA